jgi:hypothetical protein
MPRVPKHVLTPERTDLMLRYYNGTPRAIDFLIEEMKVVPRGTILYWAKKLGITHKRDWSEDDEQYLDEHISTDRIEDIAKHLKRTTVMVRWKATQMGINKINCYGFNRETLSEGFGVSHHIVQKWINAGYLTPRSRQIDGEKKEVWYFSEADVRRFILSHPLELDRIKEKLDMVWLMEMVKEGQK